FALHVFVVMPDHLHLLLTPAYALSLEQVMQFIKGRFSFRAKRELGVSGEIWQTSFTLHRVENAQDHRQHKKYILENPLRAGLPDDYPFVSSKYPEMTDPAPPWLKLQDEDSTGSQG